MPVAPRLAAFYFAYFAYVGAFVPYFPLYLSARGLAAGEIALVLAMPQFARVFAPAFWGWLADRSGARRGIVIFSCAAVAIGLSLVPFVEGAASIAAVIALTSVLSAGGIPLVEAITLSLPAAAGGYGPIRLWGSIGFVVAVLAVGAWLDVFPALSLAALFPLCALAALGIAWFLPVSARRAPHHGAVAVPFMNRKLALLLGAGFFMAVAHGALYAFYTLYLRQEGYAGATIGALWMLGVVAEIFVFLYLQAILRRFALPTILFASFIAAALRFAAIGAWGDSLAILVLAQLLHAMSFGSYHAASVAAVHRLVAESAQARGQALFSSLSYGAGGAAGALFAGWAWEFAGPGPTFMLSAAAGLAGALLVLHLRRAGL